MSLRLYVFEVHQPTQLVLKGVLNCCKFSSYVENLNDAGEFKLKLALTTSNQVLCKPNNIVWLESDVCALIEKVSIDSSERLIIVTGRMMSCLLSRRALKESLDYSQQPKTLGQVLLETYSLSTEDNPLPLLSLDIPSDLGKSYSQRLEPSNLLSIFSTLCAPENLGFRVSFDVVTLTFTLKAFSGVDRTISNTIGNSPIIVSQDNDCIESAQYAHNIKDLPNTAIVQGEGDTRIVVYRDGVIQDTFTAQEVYLDYSSETKGDESESEYQNRLMELAQDYFKQQKDENTYDTVVNTRVYTYKQDYFLGDYVTVIDKQLGISTPYQVTQVTKSVDSKGERLEPLLGVPQKNLVSILRDISQKVEHIKPSQSQVSSYYAGQGLSLSDNTFKLNIANRNDIGGIRIDAGKQVEEGYSGSSLGIYKDADAFPALRTALRYQKGGFFLGDGFVPLLEEYEEDGETKYKVTDYVQLRLGDGLEFTDNDEETTDIFEKRENSLGGRRVSAAKATAETFGVVRPGAGLMIDNNGLLRTIYSAGKGIDISELGEVSVRYDNNSIKLNDNNQLESTGAEIETAIFIHEEDIPDFVHSYQVDYIGGNRIVLAEQQPNIIVQRATAASTAFRELAPVFTSLSLDYLASDSANSVTTISVEANIISRTEQSLTFEILVDGVSRTRATTYGEFDNFGFVLVWTTIYGTKQAALAPNGYALIGVYTRTIQNDGSVKVLSVTGFTQLRCPFIDEGEYHAAIGLSTVENVLAEVTETVTEV